MSEIHAMAASEGAKSLEAQGTSSRHANIKRQPWLSEAAAEISGVADTAYGIYILSEINKGSLKQIRSNQK